MKQEELPRLTIREASTLIQRGELSPLELVETTLERIGRLNPKVNAYITVMTEEALEAAKRAEQAVAKRKWPGPLCGIPVSLKDLFATKGVRTTAGSKILADWVPDYDATVTARLRRAGAVIIGKANLHEFAAGPTNNNLHYGPARNPWDRERIPGGSSGGSAAAVAASMCLGSMGTDTGGSVRLPASLCGVVGLKPTYGRVSRFGIFPLSWSLDHAGPIARTVEDCALMLQATAGYDPRDPSSANVPVPDYTKGLDGDIRGLRVGVPREFWFEEATEQVGGLVRKAIQVLEELGASVEEVSIPSVVHSPLGLVISWSESASIHEEWIRARPEDYDPDVLKRFQTGSLYLATHYIKAQRVRALLQSDFQQALERADVILSPTSPVTAPRIGDKTVTIKGRARTVTLVLARLTRPYNLVGLPAITVPCGFSAGLPVGLQIAGRAFDEATVLRVAYAYEQAAGWHLTWPPI